MKKKIFRVYILLKRNKNKNKSNKEEEENDNINIINNKNQNNDEPMITDDLSKHKRKIKKTKEKKENIYFNNNNKENTKDNIKLNKSKEITLRPKILTCFHQIVGLQMILCLPLQLQRNCLELKDQI